MRQRDKLHTIKLGGAEMETLLLRDANEVRMRVPGLLTGSVYIWLTPAKLRALAKRLLFCADTIEGKR